MRLLSKVAATLTLGALGGTAVAADTTYIPVIGDVITLTIDAEFNRPL